MVKYCKNCGSEIKEGTKFCKECGTQQTNIEPVILQNNKGMSTGKKIGIFIIVLIAIFFIIGIFASSSTNDNTSNLQVTNLNIVSEGYGLYSVSGNLIPDKDYDYLEMQVIYYDASGTILYKDSLAWNIVDIKEGQNIRITGSSYCEETPSSTVVLIFDSTLDTDEDNAIYRQELTF